MVAGLLGYAMRKTGFEPGPLVLSAILGSTLESNLRASLKRADESNAAARVVLRIPGGLLRTCGQQHRSCTDRQHRCWLAHDVLSKTGDPDRGSLIRDSFAESARAVLSGEPEEVNYRRDTAPILASQYLLWLLVSAAVAWVVLDG